MDGVRPVTYRFDGEYVIQYATHVPHVGDRVAHAGEIWVVAGVEDDAFGAIVRCEHDSGESAAFEPPAPG